MKQRLAAELVPLAAALEKALDTLPAPARPMAAHVLRAGGKRLRPFLVVLMARLLGYAANDIYSLAVTMEMLHAATLLHDDVLDNAATRRGSPAAHTLFGIAPTILAGDALLAAANQLVAAHGDPRLTACFSEATARTAAGEILEIATLRRVNQKPQVYLDVVEGKTAWLIRASCALGALRAGAPDDLVDAAARYGLRLGMAFQMVDDALDFAPAAVTGKPAGGDLREGKLTPPLQLYRDALSPQDRAVFDAAFATGSFSDNDIETIGQRIRDNGFDAATRRQADAFLQQALDDLRRLPDGPEKAVLRQLAGYVRDRNH